MVDQSCAAARLVFVADLHPVLAVGRAALAGLTGRERAAFAGELVAVAEIARQEQLDAFTTAEGAVRACVTCHLYEFLLGNLHAAALARPAAVVRNGGAILDARDLEPRRLQSADVGLAARVRAIHKHGSLDTHVRLRLRH